MIWVDLCFGRLPNVEKVPRPILQEALGSSSAQRPIYPPTGMAGWKSAARTWFDSGRKRYHGQRKNVALSLENTLHALSGRAGIIGLIAMPVAKDGWKIAHPICLL